jgi:predicted small metal-binding protein
MLSLACKDAGYNCGFTVESDSETELMKKVMEHGKKDHGMKDSDFTPELVAKVKSIIKKS